MANQIWSYNQFWNIMVKSNGYRNVDNDILTAEEPEELYGKDTHTIESDFIENYLD